MIIVHENKYWQENGACESRGYRAISAPCFTPPFYPFKWLHPVLNSPCHSCVKREIRRETVLLSPWICPLTTRAKGRTWNGGYYFPVILARNKLVCNISEIGHMNTPSFQHQKLSCPFSQNHSATILEMKHVIYKFTFYVLIKNTIHGNDPIEHPIGLWTFSCKHHPPPPPPTDNIV